MGLSEEDKNSLVAYRLKKGKETFAELPILVENNLWRNAANRLYYACFYAASALLMKDGYQAHSHNGVRSVLATRYETIIDKCLIKTYGILFNMRQRGDYEDWAILEEEDIIPQIEPANRFITRIESLIVENG